MEPSLEERESMCSSEVTLWRGGVLLIDEVLSLSLTEFFVKHRPKNRRKIMTQVCSTARSYLLMLISCSIDHSVPIVL